MSLLSILGPTKNTYRLRRFELWKYINLQHEVLKAEWDDDAKKWRLQVRDPEGKEFEDECDVFLNGGGSFTFLDFVGLKLSRSKAS